MADLSLYSVKVIQGSTIKGLAPRKLMEAVQAAYKEGVPFTLRMRSQRGYQACTFVPTSGGCLIDVQLVKDSEGKIHEPIPCNPDGTMWDGEGEPASYRDPADFPHLYLSLSIMPWARRMVAALADDDSEAAKVVGSDVAPEPEKKAPPAEDIPGLGDEKP